MKKFIGSFVLIANILFFSCDQKEKAVTDENTTENTDSLTVDSTEIENPVKQTDKFEGKLGDEKSPITYTITLNPDETYIYQTKDDKTGEVLMTTGVYNLHDDGVTLLLDNIANGPNAFRIDGEKLIEVDKNGTPKTTNVEVNYILIKK